MTKNPSNVFSVGKRRRVQISTEEFKKVLFMKQSDAAKALGISVPTIQRHFKRMKSKLGYTRWPGTYVGEADCARLNHVEKNTVEIQNGVRMNGSFVDGNSRIENLINESKAKKVSENEMNLLFEREAGKGEVSGKGHLMKRLNLLISELDVQLENDRIRSDAMERMKAEQMFLMHHQGMNASGKNNVDSMMSYDDGGMLGDPTMQLSGMMPMLQGWNVDFPADSEIDHSFSHGMNSKVGLDQTVSMEPFGDINFLNVQKKFGTVYNLADLEGPWGKKNSRESDLMFSILIDLNCGIVGVDENFFQLSGHSPKSFDKLQTLFTLELMFQFLSADFYENLVKYMLNKHHCVSYSDIFFQKGMKEDLILCDFMFRKCGDHFWVSLYRNPKGAIVIDSQTFDQPNSYVNHETSHVFTMYTLQQIL